MKRKKYKTEATQKTIPSLIEKREEFQNTTGTMRALKFVNQNPDALIEKFLSDDANQMSEIEKSRLRIDADTAGISYVILSYDTPIAWENGKGEVYKVGQTLTQTSENHKGLLYLFHKR